jgi:hypothetical protein
MGYGLIQVFNCPWQTARLTPGGFCFSRSLAIKNNQEPAGLIPTGSCSKLADGPPQTAKAGVAIRVR